MPAGVVLPFLRRHGAALLLATCGAGLVASSSVRPPAIAPRPITPLSVLMLQQGRSAHADGDLDQATGYFEAALVADARNADAHAGLAHIAQQHALPGKAVAHFRSALSLRPDDSQLLADQGAALIQRGAAARARQNLARLEHLCTDSACPDRDRLARLLNARPDRTALRPDDVMPQPVIEAAR